jgi:hypothetical protein
VLPVAGRIQHVIIAPHRTRRHARPIRRAHVANTLPHRGAAVLAGRAAIPSHPTARAVPSAPASTPLDPSVIAFVRDHLPSIMPRSLRNRVSSVQAENSGRWPAAGAQR